MNELRMRLPPPVWTRTHDLLTVCIRNRNRSSIPTGCYEAWFTTPYTIVQTTSCYKAVPTGCHAPVCPTTCYMSVYGPVTGRLALHRLIRHRGYFAVYKWHGYQLLVLLSLAVPSVVFQLQCYRSSVSRSAPHPRQARQPQSVEHVHCPFRLYPSQFLTKC